MLRRQGAPVLAPLHLELLWASKQWGDSQATGRPRLSSGVSAPCCVRIRHPGAVSLQMFDPRRRGPDEGHASSAALRPCGPAPTCWHMDEAALAESMRELADGVRPWEKGAFTAVRRLQEAERNHGRVDEMSYQGHHVAVKRMPNWWVEDDPRAFQRKHRHQLERPWVDVGIVAELQRAHYPYTCELIGIFRDDHCTYVVSSLASHGDMFMWAEKA
ncbi:unnamed protein product, partial [Prorocentrum cordatum]